MGPADNATGDRIEGGVLGHPQHEQLWVDQELEELLDRRVDDQFLDGELHRSVPRFERWRVSAVAFNRSSGVAQNSSRNPATSATRVRSAR